MTEAEFLHIIELLNGLADSVRNIPAVHIQDKVMLLEAEQHIRLAKLYLDNTTIPGWR